MLSLLAATVVLICSTLVSKASATANCGFEPLCGQAAQTILFDNTSFFEGTYSFNTCCPGRDTQPTESCQIPSPSNENERVIVSNLPFVAEGSLTGGEIMTISNPFFIRADNEVCCPSCTCFGDPHCISFNNTEDKWILCDGRTVRSTNDNAYCPVTKATCLNQVDHEGRSCSWAPASSSIRARDWKIVEHGSPCVPNPNSGPSSLTMYDIGTYGVDVEQGERGVIKRVVVRTSGFTYSLDAENCMDLGEDAWDVPVGANSLSFKLIEASIDKVWHVLDTPTGIYLKLRCTGNYRSATDSVTVRRINVEELIESDESRIPDSQGFCVSGEISEKSGVSANTVRIEENSLCREGGSKNDVRMCRELFMSDQLTFSAIEDCREQFCSRFHVPYFTSMSTCLDTVNEEGLEAAFCQACYGSYTNQQGVECLSEIADLGWSQAVDSCLERRSDQCISSFNELPDNLTECQSGVELQYQSLTGEWITIKAFPEETPPCPDASFFVVASTQGPNCGMNVLFTRSIRFVQKNLAPTCHLTSNICSSVDGFQFQLTYRGNPTGIPPGEYCEEIIVDECIDITRGR